MWSEFWNGYNKEAIIIFSAFFMTSLFFISFHSYIKNNGSYYPETPIDLAYSVYRDYSFDAYTSKTNYNNGVVVKNDISPKRIPIFEHPGYGWLMGLVWKVTGSLKYYDMQILQIVLFVWSCLLLYWGLLTLFEKDKAFLMALSVPFFLPLLFLNVNPIRDVYCFYGAVVLFYLFMHGFYGKIPFVKVILSGFFIAFCQWMRPTIFGSLVVVSVFVLIYCLIYKKDKLKFISFIVVLLTLTNIVAFWIPWSIFNKQVHGRYFAGPSGQQLLDSMGWRGPNKINPNCPDTNNGLYCDACVTQYTIKRFNIDIKTTQIGTPEFDDQMKEAFWEWFWKDSIFWFKGLFWRIKKILFLDLTWSTTPGWNWQYYNSFSRYSDRLRAAYLFGWYGLCEFLFRRWFVRLFMLFGYVGAFCLLYEKYYFLLGLLISLTGGGIAPAIISHPEHRYLIPFYFLYPLCAGYFFYAVNLCLKFFYGKKSKTL